MRVEGFEDARLGMWATRTSRGMGGSAFATYLSTSNRSLFSALIRFCRVARMALVMFLNVCSNKVNAPDVSEFAELFDEGSTEISH